MKRVISIITLISLLAAGCEKEENNPVNVTSGEDRIPFIINFTDYADNNYFLDEVYADTSSELNMFNKYYDNETPTLVLEYRVKNLEVYASTNVADENSIVAAAFIQLPARNASQLYSDSLRYNSIASPGTVELGYFKRLSEGENYFLHPETGFITLRPAPREEQIIAAAYKLEGESLSAYDDLIYGEFMAELVNSGTTRAVLKLVKPMNVNPLMRPAWKLKLRNIYNMDPYGGWCRSVKMDIFLRLKNGDEINKIGGLSFLQLFGFDKLDETRNNNPDGIFDDRPAINYIPYTSEIIFPVLQPFGRNLPGLLGDSLKYQAIYDTLKYYLSDPDYSFIMKGSFEPR